MPDHRSVLGAVIVGDAAVIAPGDNGAGAGIVGGLSGLDDVLFPATGGILGLDPDIVLLAEAFAQLEILPCSLVNEAVNVEGGIFFLAGEPIRIRADRGERFDAADSIGS